MDLIDSFGAEGLVCVVGAGGKKSTLYRLATALDRAVITATVRIPIFDGHVDRVYTTPDPGSVLEANRAWPIGLVRERDGPDRYRGYDPTVVASLKAADVDAVLVKADGARMRLLKAPNESEPRIPANADTVLPVASARVVGNELTPETVHRVDRVSSITGLQLNETIEPNHVSTVLASSDGGLRDVPHKARVIPIINMIDSERLAAIGREIGNQLLEKSPRIDHVVLTRMDRGSIIEIIK